MERTKHENLMAGVVSKLELELRNQRSEERERLFFPLIVVFFCTVYMNSLIIIKNTMSRKAKIVMINNKIYLPLQ